MTTGMFVRGLARFSPAATLFLASCGGMTPSARDLMTIRVEPATFRITVPAEGILDAVKSESIFVPTLMVPSLTVTEIIPDGTVVKSGDVVIRPYVVSE